MPDDQPSSKDEFLHPRSRYYGEFTPSNLLFNANFQEFAIQVGYICSLETNGNISSAEAYGHVKQLFKSLKQSKKGLGIGKEVQDSGDE